jgi:hypothetical protein
MEQDNQVSPWDLVYKLYQGKYTREQVDQMTFAEVGELIDIYHDYENQ